MTNEQVLHEVITNNILPPAEYHELPDAPDWKKTVGPSLLRLGLSLESGKFVLWPYIT